ncbi:hypothetical protein BCT23_14180 [Enterovibrio norvegicus]|uniref:Uncharacterized protein n=2 Tax=Enterovibrio norvegicus TaxID=188144 RepID=A0A2N7LBH0_9GAMM|nr:hypothetical protein BCT69_23235 [Enterovibrio norvegicus]PMN92623.1 hypothetical protein BCT23_14180 [Enterovibrio norvegicus]
MTMRKFTETGRYVRRNGGTDWRERPEQEQGFWRQFSFGIPTWLWPLLICLVWLIQLAAH